MKKTKVQNFVITSLAKYGPGLTVRICTSYSSMIPKKSTPVLKSCYLRVGHMVMFMTPTSSQEVLLTTARRILIALLVCQRFIYTHRLVLSVSSQNKLVSLLAKKIEEDYAKYSLEEIDKFTVRSLKSFKFEDVSYWRSLQDRLYPRLSRFVLLSHSDRVKIYRCVQRIYESCSQEFFSKSQEEKRFSITPFVTDEINTWICFF